MMKRILFLINTLNMGGAEHVLVDIANRMAKDGIPVTVQTIFDGGYYRNKLNAQVQYRTMVGNNCGLIKKVFVQLMSHLPASIFGSILIGRNYSHLVAFVEGLPTKIIARCRHKNAKKIAWVHTDLFTNYESLYWYRSENENKKCYRKFDQVICVSDDAKRGFEKRIGQHPAIAVQYNPINKTEILEKAKEKPDYQMSGKEAFRLVALGRLAKIKGFDLLIDAMSLVRESVSRPVELYIIGGGDEETTLQEKVRALQLQDTVFLCGKQQNPYSIMRQCDMQVVSSRAEGYPLSLCEGHLLGLPAVSTKCAGPQELITSSDTGVLVEISKEALAKGIVAMVSDESAYAKYKNNAERWSENYDPDVIFNQIEAWFREEVRN